MVINIPHAYVNVRTACIKTLHIVSRTVIYRCPTAVMTNRDFFFKIHYPTDACSAVCYL